MTDQYLVVGLLCSLLRPGLPMGNRESVLVIPNPLEDGLGVAKDGSELSGWGRAVMRDWLCVLGTTHLYWQQPSSLPVSACYAAHPPKPRSPPPQGFLPPDALVLHRL
ncbi:hypothetical protein GGS23DRAFT_568571 [Durotheca rogersii]|uniref:uncharacterized protein n=1 Tax=Durotheca rogersii TaxID=419775 RepID=UPI0022204CE2|nr:uncharacterized protein GGS23DRAFT_568571 [Durotheca rogersii]KAI5863173.1 hypothetical protein GGS23DRAFT_568571 [Durotheca rogersii]